MILAFDIGNTNIVAGFLSEAGQILQQWRMDTDLTQSLEEYQRQMNPHLAHPSFSSKPIQGSVLSSVVPKLSPVFIKMVQKLIAQDPIQVAPSLHLGITLDVEAPEKVGQDRIVNGVAAYHRYQTSVITVDFGTATKLDVVTHMGTFIGGIICPGIRIIAEALVARTSQLFQVTLEPPASLIGRNTTDCLKSGLYYGYTSMIEGLITKLKLTLNQKQEPTPVIIATGGLSHLFKEALPLVDHWDADLTLHGLYRVYHLNQ